METARETAHVYRPVVGSNYGKNPERTAEYISRLGVVGSKIYESIVFSDKIGFGEAIAQLKKARKELASLADSAEEEAYALNKEYDEIIENAEEALRALDSFERSKLGMHGATPSPDS